MCVGTFSGFRVRLRFLDFSLRREREGVVNSR